MTFGEATLAKLALAPPISTIKTAIELITILFDIFVCPLLIFAIGFYVNSAQISRRQGWPIGRVQQG